MLGEEYVPLFEEESSDDDSSLGDKTAATTSPTEKDSRTDYAIKRLRTRDV